MRTLGFVLLVLVIGCEQADPPRLGAPCECPGDGAACRGGTCAIACSGDADCPAGAICQPDGSTAGGACAYPCVTVDDCPADFGLDRCDGTCYGGPLVVQ